MKKETFILGRLCIDLEKARVCCGRKTILLTRSEYGILLSLIENLGKTLSREQLSERLRRNRSSNLSRVVDTHISVLRRKLKGCGCSRLIEAVRGEGYRMKHTARAATAKQNTEFI